MIVVRMMGGLGNQMLQYATGRQLAIYHNCPLYLDLGWYENKQHADFPRDFQLQHLKTQYKIVDANSLAWKLRMSDRFKVINPFKLTPLREPKQGGSLQDLIAAGGRVQLEGFFTNYRYFQEIKTLLQQELQPKAELDATNQACLQRVQQTNSISIHIRRGDYALTGYHGMLGQDYYRQAIRYIADRITAPQLFIFSDEPEWVKENMHFDHPNEIISHNKDEYNYRDLQLMQHCKHHIIANSSFSWWGAWLNNCSTSIVVAPKLWFMQSGMFEKNYLLLNNWVTF